MGYIKIEINYKQQPVGATTETASWFAYSRTGNFGGYQGTELISFAYLFFFFPVPLFSISFLC